MVFKKFSFCMLFLNKMLFESISRKSFVMSYKLIAFVFLRWKGKSKDPHLRSCSNVTSNFLHKQTLLKIKCVNGNTHTQVRKHLLLLTLLLGSKTLTFIVRCCVQVPFCSNSFILESAEIQDQSKPYQTKS